ncbi:glycosyltransferase family 39 protein [Acetobacter fallax]|uniref:Glycosyltransferase RgtA/B/C/D-like domain-containing protein n=1 Tax=Acetobacter fallax TaxID=1737473 RepID=A0ABX0K8G2_9PROT|nr:hypothetical protein [Acetobacter fallax]NHO32644.1 hypothetical protein [Acetobacter fallax]NHO36158.1 hypothetical protein [Acetobacter fallax]
MIARYLIRTGEVRRCGSALPRVIGLVMLFGLAMRLYHLGTPSLWLDETFSAWFSSRDWRYLWQEVPRFETHPSFYYSLLKLWRTAFGDDEFTLRLLSALVNTVTIPFVAMTAYVCGGRRTGCSASILSSLLFACSATQLTAAQDARPYVFMTLGLSIALLSAIGVMAAGGRAAQPMSRLLARDPAMALYFSGIGSGIALLAWSHNFGPLFGLVLGGCLLFWWLTAGERSAPLLVNLLLSAALAGLLYAPDIPIILMQMETMGKQGFWLSRPGIGDVYHVVAQMPLGYPSSGPVMALVAFPVIGIGLTGLWALWRKSGDGDIPRAVPLTLLVMAVAPTLISFAISRSGQPVFLFRTLQPSQVPVIIMMACAPLISVRARKILIITVAMMGAAASWFFWSGPVSASEDWRGLVIAIRDNAHGEIPKVVILAADSELPFLYYTERLKIRMELLPVPGHFPVTGPHFFYPGGGGGDPGITPEMLPPSEDKIKDADQIWFVSRMAGIFDKNTLVEKALHSRFPCELRRQGYGRLLARGKADGSCPPEGSQ